jgi:hypothetical protein
MKRIQIILGLVIAVLVLGSCREIEVNTTVNNDGSFTRVITITGDSSEVYKLGLPYPIDQTWEMNLKKDTTGNEDYVLTYTKTFINSNNLDKEILSDTGWRKKLKRNIEIEKSFGFFYSYITYKETIGAANPFTYLNCRDYISNEDMLWLTGKKIALNSSDSSALSAADDTAEIYLQESATAELVSLLKMGIKKLNNPTIPISDVDKYRDSINLCVEEWNFDSSAEFVDYFARWTGNNEVLKLKNILSTQFSELDNDIEFLWKTFKMEEYNVSVEMPGLITETNSVSTTGNKSTWNVNTMSILFEDYVMYTESRVINTWMFVLAGIVLLLLVLMVIYKSIR